MARTKIEGKEALIITFFMFLFVMLVMVSLIAFVFIPNIQNDAKHKELVKTGVHTEATIVDYEYTQTVMNKEYYTLYYTFTDENSI